MFRVLVYTKTAGWKVYFKTNEFDQAFDFQSRYVSLFGPFAILDYGRTGEF